MPRRLEKAGRRSGGTRSGRVTAEDVAAIRRLFAAVDVIDAHWQGKRLPCRGSVTCPTCGARLIYVQITATKGACRCATAGCVDVGFPVGTVTA